MTSTEKSIHRHSPSGLPSELRLNPTSGQAFFASNEVFGQWVVDVDVGLSQLATTEITRDERAATMWAAANGDSRNEMAT